MSTSSFPRPSFAHEPSATRPRRGSLAGLTLGLALAAAGVTFAADAADTAMTKDQYRAEKSQIDAKVKAALKACDAQKDNAKDICREQAKADGNDAKADLEARYSGKATDREKATQVHAEGVYAVAKERCDDMTGNDKDVCVKEAKATRDKSLADLKAGQKAAEARNSATKDKVEADYQVAREKCDALSGADKDRCVADAKAKYGQ